MLLGSTTKHPAEVLRVEISYRDELSGRQLAQLSAQVLAPPGMTLTASEVQGLRVLAWMAGGTLGQTYRWQVLAEALVDGQVERYHDVWDVVLHEAVPA